MQLASQKLKILSHKSTGFHSKHNYLFEIIHCVTTDIIWIILSGYYYLDNFHERKQDNQY